MTSTYDASNRLSNRQFSGNTGTLRFDYTYSNRDERTVDTDMTSGRFW